MRARLHEIDLTSEHPDARVAVRLELTGHGTLVGEARGDHTEEGHARSGAVATLQALAGLLPDARLVLDEVVVHDGAEGRWVTVLVTALGRRGVERLVGSALVEGGAHRAAVHATLQACNRRLGHQRDGQPADATADGHEARGPQDPLTVLVGSLRLLRRHVDELDASERLALLDHAIAGADRLAAALGELHAATTGPAPTAPATPAAPATPTALRALVQRAVASAGATDGQVTVDCPEEARATAAPADVERILAAGVTALLQHGAPPVAVVVEADDAWVRIALQGSPAAAAAVPSPDGDQRHAMRAGRTPGFGLEIVRLLAEANGGAASIDADDGAVHAVRVRLPLG